MLGIAREQILGDEATSKVPKEFQTQYSHFANPPTLFMSIISYMNRVRRSSNSTLVSVEIRECLLCKIFCFFF